MENDNSMNFLNIMSSHSFFPVITKPSRMESISFSLLDNIFCRNFVLFTSGLLISTLSDHFPFFLLYNDVFQNVKATNQYRRVVKYRFVSEERLDALLVALREYDFSHLYHIEDVSRAIAHFERIIMELYTKYCPIKTKTISGASLMCDLPKKYDLPLSNI